MLELEKKLEDELKARKGYKHIYSNKMAIHSIRFNKTIHDSKLLGSLSPSLMIDGAFKFYKNQHKLGALPIR